MHHIQLCKEQRNLSWNTIKLFNGMFLPKIVKDEESNQLYFLLYFIHILDMQKPKNEGYVLENSFP